MHISCYPNSCLVRKATRSTFDFLLQLTKESQDPEHLVVALILHMLNTEYCVACGNSRQFSVGASVPQGSILGPILYNIIIDNLQLYLEWSAKT